MSPDVTPLSISRQFAKWASELTYQDLPPEVVDKIKALMLMPLVGGVIGAQYPHARDVIALIKTEEPKADGATILGDGARVTRSGAAVANCVSFHTAGLWDSFKMITHPGPVLMAAALANAEVERKSVQEMMTALAAGYEFACRLAHDFVPSTSARGFRPAPIFATMGAAMVAGKLLDLDEDRLVAAIAIAASSASGLNEAGRTGGGEEAFHEPSAARQGVAAAMMASLGHIKGSQLAIEGEAGFYATYAGSRGGKLSYVFTGPHQIELSTITEGLGTDYKLLQVMFRMYDAAGYNQPVINLMSEIKQRYDIDPDEIDEVVISMNYLETLYPSPEFPRYPDSHIGRINTTPYYAAHAAVNGGYPAVAGTTFGPTGSDLKSDQRVLDFMANKIRLVGVYGQKMFSPNIFVRLNNGQTYFGDYQYERMVFDFAQLAHEFERCVPGLPGGKARLDRIVEVLRGISASTSIAELFAATGTPSG